MGIIDIIVIFTPVLLLVWSAVHVYFKFRGMRLITCPETRKPTAIEVDAKYAALIAPISARGLRLKDCSRWPERKDCGQDCLRQIESSPEDCLVRTMLTKWYKERSALFAAKPSVRLPG
jgi:hypothetical protein